MPGTPRVRCPAAGARARGAAAGDQARGPRAGPPLGPRTAPRDEPAPERHGRPPPGSRQRRPPVGPVPGRGRARSRHTGRRPGRPAGMASHGAWWGTAGVPPPGTGRPLPGGPGRPGQGRAGRPPCVSCPQAAPRGRLASISGVAGSGDGLARHDGSMEGYHGGSGHLARLVPGIAPGICRAVLGRGQPWGDPPKTSIRPILVNSPRGGTSPGASEPLGRFRSDR